MAAAASGWLSIKFIDEALIEVQSGDGGAGLVSFLREKFRPRGGPDGGDGGRGGDVVALADPSLATLMDLRYRRSHRAQSGRPGGAKNCSGADGADCVIRLPVGTQIFRTSETDELELVADLTQAGSRHVLARGGRGGRGNARFVSAARQAPDYAQPGEAGEAGVFQLELKLLADVGLVGFPNAGKSTLVSRISGARPKIADYPFTTLRPNLGVVRVDDSRSYVVADIPGLIEGAADGAGLGIRFLKHLERTRLFVFLITQDLEPGRSPVDDYRTLCGELERYDPGLSSRPRLVALSQMDRPEVADQLEAVRAALPDALVYPISAVTGAGLDELLRAIAGRLTAEGRWSQTSDLD